MSVKSEDNGDEVALILRGKTLDEVYEIAARELEIEESELRRRYRDPNSNPGTIRMALGNLMRPRMKQKERKAQNKLAR